MSQGFINWSKQRLEKLFNLNDFLPKDNANLHNEKLVIEIQIDFEKGVLDDIETIDLYTVESVRQLLDVAKESSLNKVSGDSPIRTGCS